MKKTIHFVLWAGNACVAKFFLRIMRLTIFLILIAVIQVLGLDSYSQQVKLNLNYKNTSLKEIFGAIENESNYYFLYSSAIIDVKRKIDVNIENGDIFDILDEVLKDSGIQYVIKGRQILLKKGDNDKDSIKKAQQPISVSGNVKDSSGLPLPGVTIVVKGMTTGTITDFEGNYLLSDIGRDATLVFSFVGMETQEIQVDNQTSINISMKEAAIGIGEVVAVGYGVQKVANLTGAVTTITNEALENRAANNVSNLLAGVGSGVTVVNTGGQPGNDGSSISIRGKTTFGGSNEPLIIVDGIEATLDNIDPNDIEGMSVLKDASASAIYGVRGGNGVIIIKTKRGEKGKISVKLNSSFGFQEFTFLPEFGNSFEYATLYNEALTNDGLAPAFDAVQLQGFQNGTLQDTDWLGAITTQSGATQRYHLSLSGGSEKMTYSASLGYLDSDGLISNTNFKRYNLRINLDQKVTDKLSIGYNVALSRGDAREPALGARGIFFNAYRSVPTAPIQNADGNYVGINSEYNAVAFAELGGTKNNIKDEIIASINLNYELVKGLTFTNISAITQGYMYVNNWSKLFHLYEENGTMAINYPNGVDVENHRQLDVNIQNFFNYETSLGKHNVKALVGHHSIKSDLKAVLTSIDELPENNTSDEIALGNPETLMASSVVEGNRLESFFGRLNYNFDEKYLVEVSFRHDATSRFAPENRKEFFPSFSLGWNLNKEEFFNVEGISSLKLRGSWGQLGNQDITNLAYAPIYVKARDLWLGGVTQNSMIEGSSNPNLVWETITKTNIGLDARLFDNRLSLTADYFIEDREDILALEQIAGTYGAEAPLANVGNSNAEGIEVNLNKRGDIGNDFKYSANFNLTYFTKTPTVNGLSENAEIPGRSNGDPISNLYGYTALGLFQSDSEIAGAPDQSFFGGTPVSGDIRYADISGDGVVDANDRSSLGSYSPGLFYGLSLNADYKGFDLSLLLQGVGKVKNFIDEFAAHPFHRNAGVQLRHFDRWTSTNTNASYPVLHAVNGGRNENYVNSFFVYDASYLRLKNIQVGYTLPESLTNKIGIDKLRIYLSGENLLTFVNSEYPDGFDPEAISTFALDQLAGKDDETPITPENDGTVYPHTKTFTIGLNVSF